MTEADLTIPLSRMPCRYLRLAFHLRRFAAAVLLWARKRRTRRHLAELEPWVLRDIGVTPAEARREVRKPFPHGAILRDFWR